MDELRARAGYSGRSRFGVFEFDGHSLELRKNGRLVSLRPQPLKLLALLLARPGELIARDDLERALWGGDTFVDFEQGINHAIRELRAALGDAADSPRFVQTLPRRGYRFIGPVERIGAPDAPGPDALAPDASSTGAAPPPPHVATPSSGEATPTAPAADAHRPRERRSFRQIWAAMVLIVAVLASIAIAYVGLRPGDVPSSPNVSALTVRPFSAPADPALGIGLATAIAARLGGQQAVLIRSDPPGTGGQETLVF